MFPCNVGWTWCPLHTLKGWYHLQLFTISGIAPCTVWVLLRLFKKEKKRNFPDGLTCSSFTVQLDLQSSELYGSEGGWWREKSRQTLQSWLIVLRSFTSRIYFQKSLHINARVGANPALVIGGQSAGKEKKKKACLGQSDTRPRALAADSKPRRRPIGRRQPRAALHPADVGWQTVAWAAACLQWSGIILLSHVGQIYRQTMQLHSFRKSLVGAARYGENSRY